MKKSDVKTVGDLEKYYNQVRKIKFKENVEIKTVRDIYQHAIVNKMETTFTRGGFQCEKGRVRSLDDVIKLYKYYFPKARIKNFFVEMNILYNYIKSIEKSPIYVLAYCPNIKKYNFQYTSSWNDDYYKIITGNNRHKFKGQGFPNCDVQFKKVLES